jgi:hypothetical protein
MLGMLGRLFLLRFLPRRLIPILTVIEAIRFVRALRRPRPVQPVAPGTPVPPRSAAAPEGRARVGR